MPLSFRAGLKNSIQGNRAASFIRRMNRAPNDPAAEPEIPLVVLERNTAGRDTRAVMSENRTFVGGMSSNVITEVVSVVV